MARSVTGNEVVCEIPNKASQDPCSLDILWKLSSPVGRVFAAVSRGEFGVLPMVRTTVGQPIEDMGLAPRTRNGVRCQWQQDCDQTSN